MDYVIDQYPAWSKFFVRNFLECPPDGYPDFQLKNITAYNSYRDSVEKTFIFIGYHAAEWGLKHGNFGFSPPIFYNVVRWHFTPILPAWDQENKYCRAFSDGFMGWANRYTPKNTR